MTRFVPSNDGVPIAYSDCGAGNPALVLIHGWSCDKSYWAAQVEALARDFRIVTVDLAGHGESGTGRTAWTIDSFGHDVAAAVEAAGPRNVVLVGHSMGGNVAVAAAGLLGKRVEAVIWVDTYRKLGSSRSPEEIQEMLAPFRANFQATTDAYVRGMFPANADEGLVRRVAEDMAAAPPAIAIAAFERSLTFGRTITQRLEKLEVPVIAINAQEPPGDLQSMQSFGVEVVTMVRVGHFLMMEDPAGFNHLLRQAVSKWMRPQ